MFGRRAFLKRSLAAAGGVALLGGGVGLRRVHAVHRLGSEMMKEADPLISTREQRELDGLPSQARNQIRRYVHGLCLDCYQFAEEVCSAPFQDRLNNIADFEQRQQYVYLSFNKHVLNETQFVNRIRTIAKKVGSELDENWIACCAGVAEKWGVALRPYETGFGCEDLKRMAEPMIRSQLTAAIQDATTRSSQPTFVDLSSGIGVSAVMLFPVMVDSPYLGMPKFAMSAFFRPLFEYLTGLFRSRRANVQSLVTGRLKLLSERLGPKFEQEVRRRIADLHYWQYRAVKTVAHEQAGRTVGWL